MMQEKNQEYSVLPALTRLARRPVLWAALAVLTALGYGYAMAVPAVDMDDLAIATYQQGGGISSAQGPVHCLASPGADRHYGVSALLAGILLCGMPGAGRPAAGCALLHRCRAADGPARGAAAGWRAAAVALPWRDPHVFQPVRRGAGVSALCSGRLSGVARHGRRMAPQPARRSGGGGLPDVCPGIV